MLQVDDESTSVLMGHMYQLLMDGRTTVAQALRRAMLHLLVDEPSGKGYWRRPVFWAGFLVVGATTRLRCSAPLAQVMIRSWENVRVLLAPSLFPSLSSFLARSLSLYVSLCLSVCLSVSFSRSLSLSRARARALC